MSKLHIKKGDTVKVIAGNSKGQEGKVIEVIISKSRALVEGVNMVSKHTKPNGNNYLEVSSWCDYDSVVSTKL